MIVEANCLWSDIKANSVYLAGALREWARECPGMNPERGSLNPEGQEPRVSKGFTRMHCVIGA